MTKHMTIGEIMAIPFAHKTVIIHNDDNTSEVSYFDNLGKTTFPSVYSKDYDRTDTRVKRTEILYSSHMVDEQKVTTIHYDAYGNFLYGEFRICSQKLGINIPYGKNDYILC